MSTTAKIVIGVAALAVIAFLFIHSSSTNSPLVATVSNTPATSPNPTTGQLGYDGSSAQSTQTAGSGSDATPRNTPADYGSQVNLVTGEVPIPPGASQAFIQAALAYANIGLKIAQGNTVKGEFIAPAGGDGIGTPIDPNYRIA